MHWVGLALIAVILAALQTSVGSWIRVQDTAPSFLFIAAIGYGFRWTRVEAGIAGWVLGMAADIASAVPLGPQSLTFALAALAAHRLRSVVMVDSPLAQLLTVGALGWATFTVVHSYGMLVAAGWQAWSLAASARWALGAAAYTALLTPYLFWILDRILPLLGLRAEGKRR